jgi:ribosome-associated heat shock protein Hsp15
MSVRIDKWLFVARVYKSRALATRACELSRVRVNGVAVKAHRILAVGDRIDAEVATDWTRTLVVRELVDKTMAKVDVPRIFEDLSLPRPVADPLARLMRRPPVAREKGAGRPTKKERREMDDWKGK